MIFHAPLRQRAIALAPFLSVFVLLAGCTQGTSTSPGVPGTPAVLSATVSSITVIWARSSSDASTDTIFVTTASGANAGNSPVFVTSPTDTMVVTGLDTVVPYTIIIGSSSGRSASIEYTIGAPPTGLMVNSLSATSIGAEWMRGDSDVGYDTIEATNSSGNVVSTNWTLGNGGAVIGLQEDSLYTISIHMSSGVSGGVQWMPAERFSGIHLYEDTNSNPGDSSGLVLVANGTTSVLLDSTRNADFVLAVDSIGSGLILESGSLYNSGWNATGFNPTPNYIPGGLNNDYRDTTYSSDLLGATAHSYQIPNDSNYNTIGSRVLICKTVSGNLALVEIMPTDSTGLLYTIAPDGHKYITLNVSYQSAPSSSAPYAGRGKRRTTAPVVSAAAAHAAVPVAKKPAK